MSVQQELHYGHFIDGQNYLGHTPESLDVINPANGEVYATMSMGSKEDVNAAVAAAKRAFNEPSWREMSNNDRGNLLFQCGQVIAAHAEELMFIESRDSGGTIRRAAGMDIPIVIDLIGYYADLIKTTNNIIDLPTKPLPEANHSQVWQEAIGVCALITPWNFPIFIAIAKIVPALAAGNTIVIKPSEYTPASTTRLVQLLSQVLPKGVLNVVNGDGISVGEALTTHSDVGKVSFTGSTRVGKYIQKMAAESCKLVGLELGGKGPAIVMEDADLDLAAYGITFGGFFNSGQACESGTRILVHEAIHDQLMEKLAAVCDTLVVGNPLDPATSYGPIANKNQYDRIMGYIDGAKQQGLTFVCGGEAIKPKGFEGGYYVQPTIITDVKNDMDIAQQEIFGPVLSVIKFSDEQQAIEIANETSYGLSAGVWSDDLVHAQKIAKQLQAGSIWINDWHMLRSDAPFGGYKSSGIGREFGIAGLQAFMQTKTVGVSLERDPRNKMMWSLLHTSPQQ